MLSALRLSAVALVLSACWDANCNTRSRRDIDWDHAPSDVGFSADDFTLAFPPRWRAEVISSVVSAENPRSLQSMDQDWIWEWQPNHSRAVQHHVKKKGLNHNCNIINFEGNLSTLILPVYFEGSSFDERWAYAGRGYLVAWALLPGEPMPTQWPVARLQWAASWWDGTTESVRLTRAPSEFEAEAADLLNEAHLPAIHVVPTLTLNGFTFGLAAVDERRGDTSEFRNLGRIGQSPQFTLAEPLP